MPEPNFGTFHQTHDVEKSRLVSHIWLREVGFLTVQLPGGGLDSHRYILMDGEGQSRQC